MNICLKCSIDVYLLFDVKIQTLKHKKDSALFPENVSVFSGLFPVFFSGNISERGRKKAETFPEKAESFKFLENCHTIAQRLEITAFL